MTEEQFELLQKLLNLRVKRCEEDVQCYDKLKLTDFKERVENELRAYKNVLDDIDTIMKKL